MKNIITYPEKHEHVWQSFGTGGGKKVTICGKCGASNNSEPEQKHCKGVIKQTQAREARGC